VLSNISIGGAMANCSGEFFYNHHSEFVKDGGLRWQIFLQPPQSICEGWQRHSEYGSFSAFQHGLPSVTDNTVPYNNNSKRECIMPIKWNSKGA
jgi:hypothetical protein